MRPHYSRPTLTLIYRPPRRLLCSFVQSCVFHNYVFFFIILLFKRMLLLLLSFLVLSERTAATKKMIAGNVKDKRGLTPISLGHGFDNHHVSLGSTHDFDLSSSHDGGYGYFGLVCTSASPAVHAKVPYPIKVPAYLPHYFQHSSHDTRLRR